MGRKNPKQVVGLDFGTDIIRAVQTTRHGRDRVLQRYHEIHLPEGAIENDLIKNEAIVVTALTQLWRDARFSTKNVVLGLGNQQVLVREISVPRMKLEHIHASLPYQVSNLLPIPVDEAIVQFYPTGEFEQEGEPHYAGLMIATARVTVDAYLRLIKASGLKLVDIDYTSFAVLRGLNHDRMSGTDLIVDVRGRGTNLIVAEAGDPRFVRYVTTGSMDVFEPAGALIHVGEERMVEDAGEATDPAIGSSHIRADRMSDLVRDIRATILFYQNAHPNTRVEGLVLLCDGEAVDAIDADLRLALGLPIRFGIPEANFKYGHAVHEEEFLTTGSNLIAALGLTFRK